MNDISNHNYDGLNTNFSYVDIIKSPLLEEVCSSNLQKHSALQSGLQVDELPLVTEQSYLYAYLSNQILPTVQGKLTEFARSPDFHAQINQTFGSGCNIDVADSLINHLAQGQLLPNIEILPQSQLNADGAFGNNKIYLSENLLGTERAVDVVLEEIGHYIDSYINHQDAAGDEGRIFAKVVQNQSFAPGELVALKQENDHGFLSIDGLNIAVEHADTPGIFTVDNTGKININFLADSGSYHNEMGLFSLEGMENLTLGSVDFIKEAARRTLSNSNLGYSVIIDVNEGAKFTGELGESNRNDGDYSGVKIFDFNPNSKIAMMLVPEGTITEVFNNPNVEGSQRPLFSLTDANPNSAVQIGQLVTGTFGWEDIRIDGGTDADYNDIIFQIKGATGTLTDLGGLFAPGKDWRNVKLAQEIINFASLEDFSLTARLFQDTGLSNTDGITNNSQIVGSIMGEIGKFEARLNSGSLVNILSRVQSDGSFTFDQDILAQINGGNLTDGSYKLTLKSEDVTGNNKKEVNIDFTLDRKAPDNLGFMLDTLFDSAPIGDSQTTYNMVNFLGQTEANSTVNLQGKTVIADSQGRFKINDVGLIVGDNNITITATDQAGNERSQSNVIKRLATDNSDVVLDWNAVLLNAIYEDKTAPPIASRNMAMVQIAIFDAINSFNKKYKNYHFNGIVPIVASQEAAAASAAYRVLTNLYPKQKPFFDQELTKSLAEIPDGEAENNGVLFGQTVGDDIWNLRSTDGANTTVNYTAENTPGKWQPTAPGFASALLPQWGEVTPFALTSGDQFRPDGQPVLNSVDYATEFNQVKELGSINSSTRTAEQTEIAKFWSDGTGTFTPPGHWNQIAQNVALQKGNSLIENARLFALLDISLADAGIAAWDAKYNYDFWRPITAIQNADTDGNTNTIADPNWTPLLTTPPFPEYVSGHSTFSGAAATILTEIIGNNVSFTTNSLGTPGIYRQFSNFENAANEAGISRIYGGIHFNSANVEGLATGKAIGNYVLENLLTPITETVQKLSVMPGEQLKLESQDIFGKNANFALESEETLPTGNLDSDGTLIFDPSPSQIGSYDFTLIARDGQEITTKKFNLAVVADTETTTRISGVIKNIAQQPLAGVKVKIGEISATTNADGSFILTLNQVPSADAALIIEPGQQVSNIVYPSIAEKLPLLLGHDVYANVKNIIDRPIYLPPIDISNAQTINPTIDQIVTSAAIPGSAVTVFANSLFNQENQPYTGQLSITTVPTELTPAALPENLRPDLVVTIQPGEMVFTNPAPLSLPNLAGYAPGTEMDLWSINPQTGLFDNVGKGQVSADGTVIETIEGGIRNSSWHFFAPPAPTPNDPDADDRNPDDGCNECKGRVPCASEVELHSGAVIETHDLVPYQSLGISRGISLNYDSERADARPILHFGYNDVPNDSALRLMAELTIKRGDFELEVPGFAGGEFGLDGGEHFWSIPNGGGTINAALQADLRTFASGRYDYDLTTGLLRLNNDQLNGSTSTTEGQFLHINTVNSSFGSGWGLAGLQEIVVNPDESVIIIDGDGSELLFEKNNDGSYDSPVGDFSTLERLDDGTFRRTMTDKTVYTFNGENLLTKVSDRVGNETEYIYENRRLMKMVDPVGLETTFTYSNNRITEIKDPAGRSTKLTYDGNGNLIKITDPDGTSRTWEYDADHHMISEVDKQGNKEQTFYDFAGRADRAILKDGSQLDFDPVQVQGLYEPNKTNDPLKAPVAFQLGAATSTYTDANGNKIVNTLDRAGQIVSSSDAVGLLPSVKRNEDNMITQQTDARGNLSFFTYDAKGNVLTAEDFASSNTPSDKNNVLIIQDPYLDFSLLAANNLKETLNGFGFKTTIVSSIPSNLNGFDQIWDLNAYFSLTTAQQSEYLSFLQSGKKLILFGERVAGNVTDIARARDNSILNIVNQAGGGQLPLVNILPSSSRVLQKVNSPFNSPNSIIGGDIRYTAPGGVSSSGTGQFITVDDSGVVGTSVFFGKNTLDNAKNGELTVFFDLNFIQAAGTQNEVDQPDSQNLLKNIIQANVDGNIRRYTYDSKFNQLTSMTDELGHQTLYQIDPNNGNLLSLNQLVGEVGGDDDIITQFTYTNNGLVDLITDPLGRITDSDYDANGRLISIIYAKGTTDEAQRQFEYDLAGNQRAIIDENGNRTTFEYDALNRLLKTIEADPDGAGPLTSPITTYSYDAVGNLISTTDAVGNVNQNSYDKLNRLIQNIDALNQKTSYSYDSLGNLLSVVDPLGNKTENIYDARNRLIETVDPDNGITKFTYDLSNNLTSVIDPVNNQTTFVYDARSRLISETDPLEKVTQYQYDAVDNLIAKTDRNNRKIEYKYDDINRRITETWVGNNEVINYSYDKASNQTAVNDKFSSSAFNYDNRDRLLSVNNAGTPGFSNVVLNYSYDKVGNVLSLVDTINNIAGGNNSYSYDALNRLTKLTQSGNGVSDKRVDFGYNSLGQYTSINRYSNLTGTQLVNGTTYSYDSLNRLTNLNHSNGTNNVAFYNYVYDAASRITKITDIDGTTDYTYDNRAQLTGANHSNANNPDETYTYDANGNRITSSIHGNGYVTGQGNRLLSDGKYNYEYDNEGNLTKQTEIATGKVQELTWDYRNRLVAFVDKDAAGKETQRVEFTYDAFNRRIAKAVDTNPQDTTPAVVTQFIYDGQDVLLEFVDSDGVGANQPVLDTRYLHGAGVDQVLAQESAGNVVWLLTDHLGTVRDLVNNSGAVVNHFVYDSFGQVISESNPAIDTRYLFTGREFDQEIGLYYYRARYYDQTTGRFLSEDPIGFDGGDENLYRYVSNNVLIFVDLDGLMRSSGERGQTGSSSGTDSPFKKMKPHPTDPNKVIEEKNQTGKKIEKLKPEGFDDYWKNKRGGSRGQRGFITPQMLRVCANPIVLFLLLMAIPSNVGQRCPYQDEEMCDRL
jgi:RHS repeat-associated protein